VAGEAAASQTWADSVIICGLVLVDCVTVVKAGGVVGAFSPG
jgi:hypothetical protein